MQTATGITLLFVAATSALTTWNRLDHLQRGDWATFGGIIVGACMTVWCAVLGVWYLRLL